MLYVARHGHSKFLSDIVVGAILLVLGTSYVLLEGVNLMIWPFRFTARIIGMGPKRMEASEASALANGVKTTDHRRIVIFDGICVLCNTFGRFVVSHLPDPNVVSFIPFQDPTANPHINVKRLQEEFKFKEEELQDRIAVVDGDSIKWGADAVITILQWCYWPYPLTKLGLIVPYPIRDLAYITVATNRYRWFGTQPLEKNFAKYLCPYLYIKNSYSAKKEK